MLLRAIIPNVIAPYSSVDCIVAVYIFFKIRALTSDNEFSTLSKFIFLSVFCLYCFLKFSRLSMMIPRYLTDARHGIQRS